MVRRVGGGSDSGGALTVLHKVEEGERQLNPKENRATVAHRWLSPQRGQLGGDGGSTKFSARGAASSNGVWTLALAQGEGEGRRRGPRWWLHGRQGRGKRRGSPIAVARGGEGERVGGTRS
jgi:hypothetical protein